MEQTCWLKTCPMKIIKLKRRLQRHPPKFLRVAVVWYPTPVCGPGSRHIGQGWIVQGTYNPRKNIRGRYIQGCIAMASLNWTHSVGDSRCPATFPLACTRCKGHHPQTPFNDYDSGMIRLTCEDDPFIHWRMQIHKHQVSRSKQLNSESREKDPLK